MISSPFLPGRRVRHRPAWLQDRVLQSMGPAGPAAIPAPQHISGGESVSREWQRHRTGSNRHQRLCRPPPARRELCRGAPGPIRTGGLLVRNQARYPLRYGGLRGRGEIRTPTAEATGLQPACLTNEQPARRRLPAHPGRRTEKSNPTPCGAHSLAPRPGTLPVRSPGLVQGAIRRKAPPRLLLLSTVQFSISMFARHSAQRDPMNSKTARWDFPGERLLVSALRPIQ
jgi:hypothetical protein